MNKIGVIGHTGSVGKRLIEKGGIPLDCDVRSIDTIKKAIRKVKPDVIVNLASKSSPEWCEKDENFQEMFDVNAKGIFYLGEATQRLAIPVVTLSTDHVFSGRSYFDWGMKKWIKKGPYSEDYSRPVPANMYGMSKLAAESMAMAYDNMKIVRTSYLFDVAKLQSIQYQVTTNYRNTYSCPTFIYRSFMHTDHFVESLLHYVNNIYSMPKLLHVSGSETVSWLEFLREYLIAPYTLHTHKKDNKDFAPRPYKAGLDVSLSAKLGLPQYSYKDGLELL